MKLVGFLKAVMNYKYYQNRQLSVFLRKTYKEPFKKKYLPREICSSLTRQVFMDRENEELDDIHIQNLDPFQNDLVKNLLFKCSEDMLITNLNNCASIEETLCLFKKHENNFQVEHLVQTVLVLVDMKTMFSKFNSTVSFNLFIDNLMQNEKFICLLNCIENNVNKFPQSLLSYMLFYLQKLGIKAEEEIMQTMAMRLIDMMKKTFSLQDCARLLNVIFSEHNIRPYYLALDLIPKIYDCIGKCKTVEELGDLSLCLNKLHNLVTRDVLKEYKKEVQKFLKENKLKANDYPCILNILKLLNYPEWRLENILLMSDCMLLLKDDINLLKVYDLLNLYEIFLKNQEPGDILNNIQRYSAMLLIQIQERENASITTYLKLFASMIYFSAPVQRMQFWKDIEKLMNDLNKQNLNFTILSLLRKIFSHVKISDKKICKKYWDLMVELLNDDSKDLTKFCYNYIYFNTDIDNYRHYEFESIMMKLIKKRLESKDIIVSNEIAGYLSFVMIYGKNIELLEKIINKFKKYSQFKAGDCVLVSRSFFFVDNIHDNCILPQHLRQIKTLLYKATQHLAASNDDNFMQTAMLLNAAILRNDYDNYLSEKLFFKLKEMDYMSSKLLENICYNFTVTSTLIPEVINKCTEYVINYKNVIGFNVEKILSLCYYLAYYPINSHNFFQIATDIIIRDQERLSGLAFLQCALALCFFNELPGSFIKQIFTVEFLDKLDVELANCYSKEKYPQRVKKCLMRLNRAVCLEYPEYNVPWFHKKQEEEVRNFFKNYELEANYSNTIRYYLIQFAKETSNIEENVITPYGYYIDFVINLNDNEEIVPPNSNDVKRRLALLVMKPYTFTRFYTHLKGKYQHKIRHLEMFGYEVSIIMYNEWINLLYAGERLEFISNIIWPKKNKSEYNSAKR